MAGCSVLIYMNSASIGNPVTYLQRHGVAQDRPVVLDNTYMLTNAGYSYVEGIQPVFEPLKARHFESSWNWVPKMPS